MHDVHYASCLWKDGAVEFLQSHDIPGEYSTSNGSPLTVPLRLQ